MSNYGNRVYQYNKTKFLNKRHQSFERGETMKKSLLILMGLTLMIVFSFAYCGGGGEMPEGSTGPGGCEYMSGDQVVRGYGEFDQPNPPEGFGWVHTKPNMGNEEGVGKVLYFYATADGADRTQAENAARAYIFGNMAEAIKTQVIKQFAEAREAIGVGADQDIEAVSQSLVATRSRAEVQGALEKGHLTMKMLEIGTVDPTTCEITGRNKTFYRAIYCMHIPYDYYIQLRDGLVDQARGQLNEQQQRLMDRASNALAELDESGW